MMSLPTMWRVTILTFLLSLVTGCFQFSSNNLEEEKDPNFIEGKKRVNSLDYEGAIEYFEKALQANPRSAAAHFELGVLYEQKAHDYGAAIYHFQKHLQLRPNSPMAEVIKQHITACKLELAKTVSLAVVNREVQRDLNKLNATNNLLKQELHAAIAELQRRPQFVTNYITNTIVDTQYVAEASVASYQSDPEPPRNEANNRNNLNDRGTPQEVVRRRQSPDNRGASNERANSGRSGGTRPTPQAQRRETPAPAAATRQQTRAQPTTQSSQRRPVTFSYTVKRGETLASISRKFGMPISRLTAVNPGLSSSSVKEGRVIAIPAD